MPTGVHTEGVFLFAYRPSGLFALQLQQKRGTARQLRAESVHVALPDKLVLNTRKIWGLRDDVDKAWRFVTMVRRNM